MSRVVDFDSFKIMNKGFLEEFNIALNNVNKQKKDFDFDYDFLESALSKVIRYRKIKSSEIRTVVPMTKEKMLSIALSFFKWVDEDIYEKAVNIILQNKNNTKLNIYNVHEVKDFNEKDENNMVKYVNNGSVHFYNLKTSVHIPIKKYLQKEEQTLLNENECTLDDLYVAVHEISHIFDSDVEEDVQGSIIEKEGNNNINASRELLGEATTIAFEELLTDYLLNNTSYSKKDVEKMVNRRINSCLDSAEFTYIGLLLAKEKEKKGVINEELLEKVIRDNNMSIFDIRRIAYYMVNKHCDVFIENRYAFGGIVAPTISKKYREKGSEVLKQYFEEVRNDNFENALKVLDIDITKNGIDELISNMKKHYDRFNGEER